MMLLRLFGAAFASSLKIADVAVEITAMITAVLEDIAEDSLVGL